MSFFPLESIQIYAESIGIRSLKEDVCVAIAQDVEYRLRELIQDAEKFMHHSKRSRLAVDDINNALMAKHADPLWGFDPSETLNFRQIPHSGLFVVPDVEVDLEAFISGPLPRAPLRPQFTVHWLAIEGVQPMIPENPSVSLRQHYALPDTKEATDRALLVTAKKDISMIQEDAEVTPCVKHVLSKEMQLFYDTIISCVTSAKEEDRNCAFESLRSDAGLQQLLPYLLQYATESIAKNLRNASVLITMLQMCNCLVHNTHIFIEPYLHQVMPMLLSCVLTRGVGTAPNAPSGAQQWTIRECASGIIAFICKRFGNSYHTLVLRVLKTLTKTLSGEESPNASFLPSQYGALFCLDAIGAEAVQSILFPILESFVVSLGYQSRFEDSVSEARRSEIEKVYQLLLKICRSHPSSKRENAQLFERCFGDDFLLTEMQS